MDTAPLRSTTPRPPRPAPPVSPDPLPGTTICYGQVIACPPCTCPPVVCTGTVAWMSNAPGDPLPMFVPHDAACDAAGLELALAVALARLLGSPPAPIPMP